MKLIKITLLFSFFLLAGNLMAQTRVLTGQVLDKSGPLPGVTIAEVDNQKNVTATDVNGKFRLTVKNNNANLTVSSVGFITIVVPTAGKTNLIVTMQEDTKGLNEVVVVGYGRQTRITNTGSVSSIKGEEIKSVPTSSLQNALVGRLPGFFSQQRSGQPGVDAADFYIRGVNSLNGDSQPLIIVDDIEYTYAQVAQLNASEVESVTILKDASTTAIYGVRGANGVMVITTTRGKVGKPQINLSAQTGMDQVIRYPTYLDAYTTATLMNEAYINDSYGLSTPLVLPWTAADLQKFKDGSDPYGHPNVNWQKELLNNSAKQSTYNLNINGGNNVVKYTTSLGYFTQDGLLKQFNPITNDGINPNYFYNRVNFRSNLDISPTKTLALRFDLNGRFETRNTPAGVLDASGLFKELEIFKALSPFATPRINPDGSYGYASQSFSNGYANPVDRLANSGYNRVFNNNFNIVVGADQKLNFITQGLNAKVNVSYASNINEHRNITRVTTDLPVYLYNSASNTYTNRGNVYKLPIYNQNVGSDAFNNTTIINASLNYDRTFGSSHFNGLALISQNSYTNQGNVPLNYRAITGRIRYDYRQKYLLEAVIARNGNDLFRPGQQYGIFPAFSAGYNLAEEHYFKKLFPVFDLFKLKGSYGWVGSDKSYPTTVPSAIQYTLPGGVNFFGNGATEGALINTNVTWETERKTNLALDVNMFNGKLSFTAEYFYNYRYDQLISQGDVPLLIGQTLPSKNIGITSNTGYDGVLAYRNKVGKLGYSISGNISFAKNKIVYISEAPDYPYQSLTGRQLGLTLGYHNIGFYQVADFDANGQVKAGIAKPAGVTIQPGDLKFADMNNDGVITSADRTYLSKPNLPTTTYGINLGFTYQGFSLTTLIQGAYGYALNINAEGADAFVSNLRPAHLDSWTPATAFTATLPRLGFNVSSNNNTFTTTSDYSFVNASYVRLKSLELGYQIPQDLLKKAFIRTARIYATGYNLLTWKDVGRFSVDPEIASGQGQAYPLTANYSLGIQLGF
ncbi:MAG: TonB-dependent receptor [Bacteroidota bacterium]